MVECDSVSLPHSLTSFLTYFTSFLTYLTSSLTLLTYSLAYLGGGHLLTYSVTHLLTYFTYSLAYLGGGLVRRGDLLGLVREDDAPG